MGGHSRVISTHSYRRGTGKTTLTASLAYLLASGGLRVGVIDLAVQTPGLHVLLGMDAEQRSRFVNDYLVQLCPLDDVVHDLSPSLTPGSSGCLWLLPADPRPVALAETRRDPLPVDQLAEGCRELQTHHGLDVVLLDNTAGTGEQAVGAMTVADTVLLLVRPDQQDYQGTGALIDVADTLSVSHTLLVVNEVPPSFERQQVQQEMTDAYGLSPAVLLPHTEAMSVLGSRGLFVRQYPDHPLTAQLKTLAARWL